MQISLFSNTKHKFNYFFLACFVLDNKEILLFNFLFTLFRIRIKMGVHIKIIQASTFVTCPLNFFVFKMCYRILNIHVSDTKKKKELKLPIQMWEKEKILPNDLSILINKISTRLNRFCEILANKIINDQIYFLPPNLSQLYEVYPRKHSDIVIRKDVTFCFFYIQALRFKFMNILLMKIT